jgi:prepilin-type N-terminal cleavage/methylation domain-containing protein
MGSIRRKAARERIWISSVGRTWVDEKQGFSLIELLVVLILLSLSLALVAPSLSRFSRTVELKERPKGFWNPPKFQERRINKGKSYQVVFNSQSREVSVQSMEPSEEKDERKEGPIPAKTYLLPEGIQMKGSDNFISSTTNLSPQLKFSKWRFEQDVFWTALTAWGTDPGSFPYQVTVDIKRA